MSYTSHYPTQDNDHVKATTTFNSFGRTYKTYWTTDPTKSLTGDWWENQWHCGYTTHTNNRYHIDLGEGFVIKRIYYESSHEFGNNTYLTMTDFTFWGSNESSSFSDLVYSHDTDWNEITCDDNALDLHVSSDISDPKYINLTNSISYRYYAFKFPDVNGGNAYGGVRRIELQTEDGGGGAEVKPGAARLFGLGKI